MLHHDEDLLCAGSEIHRAADRRNGIRIAGVPIGEVAHARDLKRAQHGQIDMTAAHHRKGRHVIGDRGAGHEAHEFLAGIDDVGVVRSIRGRIGHADNAILAVQDDLTIRRQVLRDQRRHADAEIDVGAVGNVARDELGDLYAGEFFPSGHCGFRHSTTRCTKMPGVITCSGGKAPSGTISCTCATAVLAAMHMTGPKLRCA